MFRGRDIEVGDSKPLGIAQSDSDCVDLMTPVGDVANSFIEDSLFYKENKSASLNVDFPVLPDCDIALDGCGSIGFCQPCFLDCCYIDVRLLKPLCEFADFVF